MGKAPKYYPAEDPVKPKKYKYPGVHKVQNPPRIRKSLTPGTVLIILAGRFRGKRVVLLKVLESGLLLITGPYKINGVPIRRMCAAFVIATSTKVDVSGIDVKSIDDAYFSRDNDPKEEDEEQFFKGDPPKKAIVSDQRKADQKKVDDALLKVIAGTDMLEGYLRARFSLRPGDKPHLMKF